MMMSSVRPFIAIAILSVLTVVGSGAGAQSTTSKSDYQRQHTPIESGDSVTEDIHEDDQTAGAFFALPSKPLEPWFAAKRRWNERFGLKLNFSYQALYQDANNPTGEDSAAAGRGEINGSWTLLGRGTQNAGRLTFRLENRNAFGGGIPPSKLGGQFGSATVVGTGFSDYGTNLSELAWRQSLLQGKMRFAFGKISAVSWYGGHAMSSPKRAFQNTAFMASNTRATPGRGFGVGFAYQFNPKLAVVAGIHDANAKTTGNPFDTIGQGEFLQSVELRFNTTTPDRARWDQIRLMYWHQDERVEAGISESQGVSLVASHLFNDNIMPFLVAGISDGNASILKKDLAVGVGIGVKTTGTKARDVFGIGLAWGEPSNTALQDQYTSEFYYRFQLLENIAITPSIQFVRNPAANPDETTVSVLGLRLRATF